MALNYDAVIDRMNAYRPGFDWDQECSRLVWYSVWTLSGLPESQIIAYDPALAGYRASAIESTDPSRAPIGAIHFWDYGSVGHVAVDVEGGGSTIFMTGNSSAVAYRLDRGGSRNYGLVSFDDYQARKGHPYLGWSRRFGANASIVQGDPAPAPTPEIDSEEEDMKLQVLQADGSAEIYAVNRLTGKKWHIPNMDYLGLLRARGIVTDDVLVVPLNEFEFFLALWETVGAADSSVEGKLDQIAAQITPRAVQ